MTTSVGFIGAGRVARIMLGGWQRAQSLPEVVLAYDQSADAVAALTAAFPTVRGSVLAEAAGADIVFGALHPPALVETLPLVAAHLRPEALFCSLAPKVRLPALVDLLGGFSRVARMNPNAPAIVNAGFNPVAYGAGLPQQARSALQALVAPLGRNPEVADERIETYAVISAMGPTYFWFQFDEVLRLAEAFGLTRAEARQAVSVMLKGAVATMLDSDLTAREVMDLVPLRPLADDEPAICAVLQQRLGAVYQRLAS